jgi:hypothetical protein
MSAPGLRDGCVFPAPWPGLKGLQGGQASFGIVKPGRRFEAPLQSPSCPSRTQSPGVADQVYNPGLHHGLGNRKAPRMDTVIGQQVLKLLTGVLRSLVWTCRGFVPLL